LIGSVIGKITDYVIERVLEDPGVADLHKLKDTLLGTERTIGRVENMWIKDEGTKKRLKKLVMELKDTVYDADDLLDEIQFRVLKQQGAQGYEASNQSSSSSDLPPSKRRRLHERVGRLFGREDDVIRVGKIQMKLEKSTADIKNFIPTLHAADKQMITSVVPRTTTSFPIETQVFGREKQLNDLLERLMISADGSGSSNSSISTLTIFGIGGVGKTTLAQHAYHHERLKDYFHHKVWLCVSDNFNVERLTKEIIESLTRIKPDLSNLNTLQEEVKEKLTSKRFLLVLDDVWNEDRQNWEIFRAPLWYGEPGSKILVTTRSKKIAEMVGNPIPLGVLDEASYWKLFKKCAFGSEYAGEFPQLEAIAKKIVGRLKGLPLAARTVGGLLKAQMNEKHWRNIAGSEIWQLQQDEQGVLPVLQLSYQCLPSHLKRCFVFCSLFPKDHRLPHGMSKLINLMHLYAKDEIISKINNVGKLTSLRGFASFKVLKDQGHKVAQLDGLTQLHGELQITNLENIESKQEAGMSNMNNKQYLDALALEWTLYDGSGLDGNEIVVSEEVLEGLQPHQALKRLTIRGYIGVRSPSWLQAQFKFLPNLEELVLENMVALEELPSLGQLPCLKVLRIKKMPAVKKLGNGFFGSRDQGKCFPSLEELTLIDMPEWEEWSWADGRQLFPCLRELQIVHDNIYIYIYIKDQPCTAMSSLILATLGSLGSSCIGSLIRNITDCLIERVSEDPGVADLHKLRNTLSETQLKIGRVENMWIKDEDTKKRLKELLMKLKDTVYDADDLLDEIQFRVLKQQIEQQGAQGIKRNIYERVGRLFGREDDVDRVRENQSKLDEYTTEIKHFIDKLDNDEKQMITSVVPRTTTSFPIETQVFGRDEQLNQLLGLLMQSADGSGSSDNSISTLTIVGIGGVGKTTLAQEACNHERVKDYFHPKVWVCVSDNFNVERLTKEIIESITEKKCDVSNLDKLQKVLKKKLTSKRFLLVLDDVWNEDSLKWKRFCAPLRHGEPGSKILVTTRSKRIADMVGNPFPLDVLDDASYWEFFKQCAFGSKYNGEYPQLETIAGNIAYRLNGLPLAARTVGGLLKAQMNEKHWRNIAGSEIWQLQQDEEGVLPVLQLSYQCLPSHLKRCFVFCSLFLKDRPFDERDLIRLWMAEGYVAQDNNMTIEDTGSRYFLDLVNRSFFDEVFIWSLFQEDPLESTYVMHDLINDLAQFISKGEFCRIEYNESKEIPNTTRHLSATLIDKTKVLEFSRYEKLRTLMINYGSHWYGIRDKGPFFHQFERLKNIRVLILQSCGLWELPETIGGLIHLRYLNISYNSQIWRLPESLCGLYNLRVLDLFQCELQSFPHGMSKLINLMHLNAEDEIIFKINDIGKLISLQGLSSFKVLKDQRHEIAQLSGLKRLHGQLRITNLENVESKQEASKANLNNKQYLDKLVLQWISDDGSSLNGNELVVSEEVLEGLQPHQALKRLTIEGYGGVRSPSWLQAQLLVHLGTLRLINCKAWKDLSCIGQLPNLKNLYVEGMPAVKQISHGLSTESKFLPNLEELVLKDMVALEELLSLGHLPSLKVLHIERLPAVKEIGHGFFNHIDKYWFPRLEKVHLEDISACEELPCLGQLSCLKVLHIEGMSAVTKVGH
ncbi:unnamed protein product, partial [Musa acuminata var. zebrina]